MSTARGRTHPRRWAVGLLAGLSACAASIVAGVLLLGGGAGPAAAGPRSAPLPSSAGANATVVHPTPAAQHLAAAHLRIPSLGVTAAIGTSTVTNGVLTPPRIPMTVGAWTGSAPLSSSTGEVTIAGHVNWTGMAPFAFGRLASLQVGALVYTSDKAGQQTAWRVSSVTARSKGQGVDWTAFAGASGPRTLALITCGGTYDSSARSYESNVYVIAHPVG